MSATDSMPLPKKNVAFRLYFSVLDADGEPVTGFTSPDSERSLDGAAFADCTNEATHVGHGQGYVDLTAGEMNADHVGFWFSCTEGDIGEPISICPGENNDIISAAEIRADVGLAAANLDTQLGTISTNASGAAGQSLTTNTRLGSPVGASFSADIAAIKAETVSILLDTDSLDTTKITTARAAVLADLIDGGRLDLLIDAVKAKTDIIPGSPAAVGSAMTLADGAITDAKFTIPTLTTLASGPVGMIVQTWRRLFKKSTQTKGSSAELKTYADNGSTVITTQDVDDDGTTTTLGGAS